MERKTNKRIICSLERPIRLFYVFFLVVSIIKLFVYKNLLIGDDQRKEKNTQKREFLNFHGKMGNHKPLECRSSETSRKMMKKQVESKTHSNEYRKKFQVNYAIK